MVDLSGNHSMVNPRPVLREELRRTVLGVYLAQDCGSFPRDTIVRWGIFSALGSEPPWGGDLHSQVMYEPEIGVFFLAYGADRKAVEEGRALDRKAARAAVKAREDLGADERRRRAELINLFESGTTADTLNEILDVDGVDRDTFEAWLSENLMTFAESVPNIDVWCELVLRRDKNADHKTDPNDLKDLAFLQVAIPYGNIVVTERSWAHLANTAGLDQRYDTKILANAADGRCQRF